MIDVADQTVSEQQDAYQRAFLAYLRCEDAFGTNSEELNAWCRNLRSIQISCRMTDVDRRALESEVTYSYVKSLIRPQDDEYDKE